MTKTQGFWASDVLYAVRHRETGKFMPQRPTGRGYTYWEPLGEETRTPRLFPTKRGAQIAVACWAQGEFRRDYHPGDWGFDDGQDEIAITPREDRTKTDLEVVPIRLTQVPDPC